MAETILITGGTGFIGSRLLQACVKQGQDVRVLAQATTAAEAENLKHAKALGAEVALGSVTDAELAARVCHGVDTVYHLAAVQHEAGSPNEHFENVNVTGTRNMIRAALGAGVRRFVHGSTIGVYQAGRAPVSDHSPTVPDNIYGVTKLRAENLLTAYQDRSSIGIIRISETYGPGDRRLLKLFKAIGAGKFFHIGNEQNLHHPVYIDDLIAAFQRAATVEAGALPRTPMVVPGYEALTTRKMVQHIAAALNVETPARGVPLAPFWAAAIVMETTLRPLGINPPLHRRRMHFFTKSFRFTGDIAKRALNYQPTVSFGEGAKRTAHWYRSVGLIN